MATKAARGSSTFRRQGGAEASTALQGPWETAQSSAVQFNRVKNEVSIAVRPGTLDAATYQTLMQRADANGQSARR